MISEAKRHTWCGCTYVHYLVDISRALMITGTTTRQRNDEVVELHSTGTLLGQGLERDILLDINTMYSFSCIWHDKPGEYFECTLKLTANKANMTNNNKHLAGLMHEYEHGATMLTICVKNCHGPSDQLTISGLPRNHRQ
jgi:hypothetical protein